MAKVVLEIMIDIPDLVLDDEVWEDVAEMGPDLADEIEAVFAGHGWDVHADYVMFSEAEEDVTH